MESSRKLLRSATRPGLVGSTERTLSRRGMSRPVPGREPRTKRSRLPPASEIGGSSKNGIAAPSSYLPSDSSASLRDPSGIVDVLKTFMPWSVTDAAGFVTRYVLANSLIDPDLGAGSTNFQYVPSWSGMYNYYEVEKSEFNIVFTNTDDQTKVVVVFPTLYPPGSGNVPTTLDSALHYPGSSSHYVLGNQGGDSTIVNIDRTLDIKAYLAEKNPLTSTAPQMAGKLPSVTNGGVGSAPSTTVWWVVQVYPTNDVLSGTDNYDITLNLLGWAKLFGVVLSSALTASTVNMTPLWLKEHPKSRSLRDPDPIGSPAVSILQKFDYSRYAKSVKDDSFTPVYPVMRI
jgi:hypothetical protein